MFSNKTESNIESNSASLPGIDEIFRNFDRAAGVMGRSKARKRKDAAEDEAIMLDDLRHL